MARLAIENHRRQPARKVLFVTQMLQALNVLHENGLCHGEVRMPNIVYVKTIGWVLVDFDLCCPRGSTFPPELLHHVARPPALAPGMEMLPGHDLWQLGECITGSVGASGSLAEFARELKAGVCKTAASALHKWTAMSAA
jgi:serine/threonine protein kinase